MVSSKRSGGHCTPSKQFSGVEDKNGVFTKILRSSNSHVEGNGSLLDLPALTSICITGFHRNTYFHTGGK